MRMVRSFREYVGIAAGPERNQVRITSHEARIAAILHDLNDVAGEQVPLPFAPACQCNTAPPSKCPPQLISVRPSHHESVVPSQNRMRELLRITRSRSAVCKNICASNRPA